MFVTERETQEFVEILLVTTPYAPHFVAPACDGLPRQVLSRGRGPEYAPQANQRVLLNTGFRRHDEIMTTVAIFDKPLEAIAKPMIALAENPLPLYI